MSTTIVGMKLIFFFHFPKRANPSGRFENFIEFESLGLISNLSAYYWGFNELRRLFFIFFLLISLSSDGQGIMSFYFLPTDTWIPAKYNSELNPIASVWLRSSLVNCLSLAPVVPLLRGWALYVSNTSMSASSSSSTYRNSIDALLRPGMGSNLYRGLLPLIASVPITCAFSLPATLSMLMLTSNENRYSMAASSLAIITAGEICIQPFRYFYLRRAADTNSIRTYRYLWQSTTWLNMYKGILPFTAASLLIQIGPHLTRLLGFEKEPYQALIGSAFCLAAYPFYVTGFRRVFSHSIAEAPTIASTLRNASPLALLQGIIALTGCRVMITLLQANLSAHSEKIPF